MSRIFYDLMRTETCMNYRWVQPPQIVYLVSTVDNYGNVNVTPVSLGTCVGVNSLPDPVESNYFFAFSVGNVDLPNLPARGAYHNLETVPECAISYPSSDFLEKIWVAALPLPRGINEMDVAGFTPLPSRRVRPPGIQECPVNMEAVVKSSCQIGAHFKLYICQVVGVSVAAGLIERDETRTERLGVLNIDPLFEVSIAGGEGKPPRMYFGKIDRDRFYRTPDDIGSSHTWIGTFETWMEDEVERGKIDQEQMKEILVLNKQWQSNPDPKVNHETKLKLTRRLTEIVWDRK